MSVCNCGLLSYNDFIHKFKKVFFFFSANKYSSYWKNFSLQISKARFSNKNVFSYFLSIHHKVDFNRIWCFDHRFLWCWNSPANYEGKNIKTFWYFRFHNLPANFKIREKGQIRFCLHLREKNYSPRNSPRFRGWIYNSFLVWTTFYDRINTWWTSAFGIFIRMVLNNSIIIF